MGSVRRRARLALLAAAMSTSAVTTAGLATAPTGAGAQPAPGPVSVSADPATGLRHGDTAEVTVTGFGGQVMGIFQCPTAFATPATQSRCDMLHISISATDPLVIDLRVREILRAGGLDQRCGAAPGDCSLLAFGPANLDTYAVAPLDIVQGPLAFADGQYEEGSPVRAYVVAPPAGGAQLAQCVHPVGPTLAGNRCTATEPVALDPDGRAVVPFTTRLHVPDPGGDLVCPLGECDLTLYDGDGDLLRTLPLQVLADDGPPTLAVTPHVELHRQLAIVEVQVRQALDEDVVVAQCDAAVASAAEVTEGPCGPPLIDQPAEGNTSGFNRDVELTTTIDAVDGSTVDCTVAMRACVVALASEEGHFAAVPISFSMPDEVALAPAAGLVDQEEVTVTATGLTPGIGYYIRHCEGVDETPGATWNGASDQLCAPVTAATPAADAGPDGTLTVTVPALQRFRTAADRRVVCRDRCQLAVVQPFGLSDYSIARYTMATATVTATPSSGLADGQAVAFAGSDVMASYEGASVLWLVAGRWGIGQCRGAVRDDPTLLGILEHCAVPPGGPALDVPGSTFDVPVTVAAEFTAALGDPVDCRAPGTDCVLVAARIEDDLTTTLHATTPLTFTS